MRRGSGRSVAAAAVAVAALALIGGSSVPAPAATAGQPPHISHPAPAPAHLFGRSLRTLPQARPVRNDEVFPRPKWSGSEGEPGEDGDIVKGPLPGVDDPAPTPEVSDAPAPGPGGGGDPFSGAFAGLDHDNWGAGWPPDTNGDVGPDYYIESVNTSIGIFRKTDGARVAAFTLNNFWAGAGTGTLCDTTHRGDPTVEYDPLGDRWIIGDLAFTGSGNASPYYECIAVSRTGDPVNGGWYLYAYRADDAAHPWLNDYPKMSIWPDGLYMTANMFCFAPLAGCSSAGTYREVRVWALNRNDLESGAPVHSVVVDLNTPSFFALLPANVRPPAGTPPPGRDELLVDESQTLFAFDVWKFHVDYTGSGSTFTGPTSVSQASYSVAATTAPSPANSLDTLRERLMNQVQYTNLGGAESLWVNHTTRCCGTNTPAGIQWAQIKVTGGTVTTTPAQQQLYPSANDGLHRWMGSLAVDHNGDAALGYSVSSATTAPDIRYAGRLATDPLNTLPQTETMMLPGVTRGSQQGLCGGGTCIRWGDYTEMTLDPNGCTFWYANEYYATTGLDWQTRIGSFNFPSCTPAKLNATVTAAGASGTYLGTVDLTATLTRPSGAGSLGLPGRTIAFSINGSSAGSATTDTDGVAALTNVSLDSIGAGAYPDGIQASFAGDTTYEASTGSAALTIAKADQTIVFDALADKTFGDPDFVVTATASSGLPVSFSAAGTCTVLGALVHLAGAGSCTITASQDGDGNYNPAPDVPRSFAIATREQTINFDPLADKTYGDADFTVVATASSGLPVSFSASGDCTVAAALVHIAGAGSCSITASQAGDTNYLPADDVTRTFTIASAVLTVKPSPERPSRQYSDPNPSIAADISGYVNGEDATALTSTPGCGTAATPSSAPGSYPITCSGGAALNYRFVYSDGTLTVSPEDARAIYNGNTLFWTASTSSNTAAVTLSAAVQDISSVPFDPAYDPFPGDVRNARVTFVNRDSGLAFPNCSNLPIALTSAGTGTGAAICTTSLTTSSSTGATQYTVGIVVSGFYTRNAPADNVVVDVAQPLTSNFITGGGYIVLARPGGFGSDAQGTRANFGFNVKYNKPGTNLQGGANVIVRSGGRVYQVKSNAILSLGVAPPSANFTAKANITDVTDPLAPVALDGGGTIQLWLTDNGEPGSADTIGIQVFTKDGRLWFSSNWDGVRTVEQLLAGGNLAVH